MGLTGGDSMSIRNDVKAEVKEYEGYYSKEDRVNELRRSIRAIKKLSTGFEHDEFNRAMEIILDNKWELIRDEK